MTDKPITFGSAGDGPFKWEEWVVFNEDGAWTYMNGRLYAPWEELPEPKESHVLDGTATPGAADGSAGEKS